MRIHEWYPILAATAASFIFHYFWITKVAKKEVKGIGVFVILILSSFFVAWGIDVIQKYLDISSIVHIIKISLGCWIMFAVATGSKHYAINGMSKKKFWIDYGGDLVSYLLSGILIWVLG